MHTILVKQNATLDSSFWINAIAGGVVDYLLEDYELTIGPTVARELPETYPGGAKLHSLIREKRIAVLARLAARGTVSPQLIALALAQIATLLQKDEGK